MTWIPECTNARNAVNSHTTKTVTTVVRSQLYILWLPHDTEPLIAICHIIFQAYKQNAIHFILQYGCIVLAQRKRNGCRNGFLSHQKNNSPEKHNRPVARANKMTTTMITSNATPTTIPMIGPRSNPLSADNSDELIRTL